MKPKLIEITDEQQASMEDVPRLQTTDTMKYVIPPELYEAEQLRRKREPDQALRLCVKYMNLHPNHVPAILLAANILYDADRFGLAHPLLMHALKLEPEKAVLWNNLALCHVEMGELEQAETALRKAVSREPDYALAWNSLANVYVRMSEPDKAIRCADKAFSLDPRIPECRFNRSLANLMLGNYKDGWEEYDFNLGKHEGRRERIFGIIPRWTGVKGLTVAAYGEQGLGDEIAFASCIPDLGKENDVIFECDARLEGLFRRSFGKAIVYGTRYHKGVSWPLEHKLDASVALGSLPGFYRNSAESFPGEPYLIADPERRLQWRALLDSIGPRKKIGIAWTGGIRRTGTAGRSLSLADLEPILRQDADFISLQYKDASAEIDKLYDEKELTVRQWKHATLTQDYDDTAALVAELDLVICVTTAVVDLAGALGKSCWVLVNKQPHWRYGLKGDSYQWAKSVKLYRQTSEWIHPISEIARDLRKVCSPLSAS